MGYTDQFTNTLISPVNKRYRLITLTSDTELVWPIESATSTNTLLEWMDVTEDQAGWEINFPDATGGAQGFSSIIVNTGAYSFTVNDYSGNVIQVIATGEAWLLWLKDNSTEDGDWQALQIGSTTSEASASTLAGNGLTVIGLTLNQSHPVWDVSGNYTVVPAQDRARVLLWTSGSGTISFPSASSMGDNWFTLVRNEGSASVSIDPNGAELIDGASSKSLAIGESCFVISSGSALYTVGYGRSVDYIETYSNINVAGNSDITLTSQQFSSNVIRIFGALTGDIDLIVPAAVHTFILVNDTTGSYSVTVKVSGETGVVAQQSNAQVLYCNGTDVFAGNTVNTVSTGLFNNGTVTTPSISFTSDTNTGLFLAASDTLGIAGGGILSALFNTAVSAVNCITFTPAATGVAAAIGSYSGTDTNVGIRIAPQGSGDITFVNAAIASSTLSVVGDFSVNTNKFTIAASSGNTLIAGTLGVTGSISGNLIGNVTGNLTGNVTGNVSGSSGSCTGNSATATSLLNARLFSITGSTGLTASGVSFDGTASVALSLSGTLAVANGGTGSDLSATGGTSRVLKQTSVGGSVTVAQLAASDLSNGVTGSGAVVLASASIGRVIAQKFLSSGTYTPTSGMIYCVVRMVGGGGSSASGFTGGGAGEYAEGVFSSSDIGASKTVTIGAAEGTTSLGSLMTAIGATGQTGGSGGTGGYLHLAGADGNFGSGSGVYGAGANSVFGGAGYGNFSSGGGNAKANTGGGAGGGTGTIGGTGLVIITEYCSV